MWKNQFVSLFLPLLFLTGFFCSYLAQAGVASFTTVDAFYHSSQSAAYLTDETVPYPFFSYFSMYPADIWIGYHYGLGVVSWLSPEEGPTSWFKDSYYFHAFLSAALITLLFYVSLTFYKRYQSLYVGTIAGFGVLPNLAKWKLAMIFLAGCWLLTLLVPELVVRLGITQRPHIMMVLIVLCGILTLLNNKPRWLFFLAALSPLVYSFSIFVWLPCIVLVLGWIVEGRKRDLLSKIVTPIGYTFFGYALGIWLHPNSIGYIINGLGFPSYAIIQTLFSGLIPEFNYQAVAYEMQSPSALAVFSIVSVLVLLSFVALLHTTKEHQEVAKKTDSYSLLLHTGLLYVSMALLFGSLVINRLTEYALPLASIILCTSFAVYILPLLHRYAPVTRVGVFFNCLPKQLRLASFLCLGTVLLVVSYHVITIQYAGIYNQTYQESDRYNGVAQYLKNNPPMGIILPTLTEMYGQLLFWGNFKCLELACDIQIATGMDIRKLHFFDGELARGLTEVIGFREECYVNFVCGMSQKAAYNLLKENNISLIIFDGFPHQLNPENFMTKYDFLEIVYTDEKYPNVLVYAVKEPSRTEKVVNDILLP